MIRCSKLDKAVKEEGERDRDRERERQREKERERWGEGGRGQVEGRRGGGGGLLLVSSGTMFPTNILCLNSRWNVTHSYHMCNYFQCLSL